MADCFDANNTVNDPTSKSLAGYCAVSASTDGATFSDIRIPCLIGYSTYPFTAQIRSFTTTNTDWSASQNCSDTSTWNWSGSFKAKASKTLCGPPKAAAVNMSYSGELLFSMTSVQAACPSNLVTSPCVGRRPALVH